MRTREEQISALSCCLYGQDMTANRATAERMVHEAEQRVRAEMSLREEERLSKSGNAYANVTIDKARAENDA